MYQTVDIPTKYGTISVAFTDADHCHAHANANANRDDDTRRCLTIRGIPYGVSLHLFRQDDGSWQPIRRNDDGSTDYSYSNPYMSRFDRSGYRESEPSNAARVSAREEIVRAVNAYVTEHPAVIAAAGRADWERQVEKAEKAVQDALDGHAAALEHLRAVRAAEPFEDRSTPWKITKDGITFQAGYKTATDAKLDVAPLLDLAPAGTVYAVTKDYQTGTSYHVGPDRAVTVKEITA